MDDLKTIRKEKGYSQAEAAKALGCSSKIYGQWERGERPIPLLKVSSVYKIMKSLKVRRWR